MYWYMRSEQARRRFQIEASLMQRYTRFQLYQDDSTKKVMWKGALSSHGRTHREVKLVYSSFHPDSKMDVYVMNPKLRQVNHHIYSDGQICYEMGQWRPEWTALQVACLVQHFLNELYSGKMNDEMDYPSMPGYDFMRYRRMLRGI